MGASIICHVDVNSWTGNAHSGLRSDSIVLGAYTRRCLGRQKRKMSKQMVEKTATGARVRPRDLTEDVCSPQVDKVPQPFESSRPAPILGSSPSLYECEGLSAWVIADSQSSRHGTRNQHTTSSRLTRKDRESALHSIVASQLIISRRLSSPSLQVELSMSEISRSVKLNDSGENLMGNQQRRKSVLSHLACFSGPWHQSGCAGWVLSHFGPHTMQKKLLISWVSSRICQSTSDRQG